MTVGISALHDLTLRAFVRSVDPFLSPDPLFESAVTQTIVLLLASKFSCVNMTARWTLIGGLRTAFSCGGAPNFEKGFPIDRFWFLQF